MSQKKDIWNWMKNHRGQYISPLQALQWFGCLNLRNRVGELRRDDGRKIRDRWFKIGFGKNSKYCKEYGI